MSSDDFRKDSQDFNKSGDTENNGIISQAKKSAQDKLQNKIDLERKESIKYYNRLSSQKSRISKKLIENLHKSCNLSEFVEDLVLRGKSQGMLSWSFNDVTLVASVAEYNREASKAKFPGTNRKISEISISETIENHLKSEGAKQAKGRFREYTYYCEMGHFESSTWKRSQCSTCVNENRMFQGAINAYVAYQIYEPMKLSRLNLGRINGLPSLNFEFHINL